MNKQQIVKLDDIIRQVSVSCNSSRKFIRQVQSICAYQHIYSDLKLIRMRAFRILPDTILFKIFNKSNFKITVNEYLTWKTLSISQILSRGIIE